MKQLIVILCFFGLNASAQNGFFLQGHLGAGTSSFYFATPVPGITVDNVVGLDAGLNVGFQRGHWNVGLGLEYLKTGNHSRGIDPIANEPISATLYYNNLLLPLSVAYAFKLNDRVAVAPSAGAAFSYDFATNGQYTVNGIAYGTTPYGANTTGYFILVGCDLTYAFNSKIKIMAGLQSYNRLMRFFDYSDRSNYRYNYAYTLNLGVRWLFHRHWSRDLQPEGF